jgi:hypothetical protein
MAIDPITPDVPSPGVPDQQVLVMSSEIGNPVPDLAGTAKIAGHLLFYGKERSEPVYSSGGGGGGKGGPPEPQPQITGYKYYMSWGLGVVAGQLDALYAIYRGEDIVWEGSLACPASGGKESVTIDGMGLVDFYFGTADQVANSKVASIIGDATLNSPMRNMCWAFFDDCYIGEYNRCPTMSFIMKKIPEYSFSADNEIQVYDSNPAHAMWYVLHDLTGLPESWLHSSDFTSYATTLDGENRGMSILFDRQQNALTYLESINAHVDGILRYGIDGKFHPKLIRNDYVVGDLPVVDESVMLEEPTLNRRSWIDTINEVKVQYSELYRIEEEIVGGNCWVVKAPRFNVQDWIYSLVEFNGKIYGGTRRKGCLFEWNGVDAWLQVAPQLETQDVAIRCLVVFNNKVYGATGYYGDTGYQGRLLEWNGIDAWNCVAERWGDASGKDVLSLCVFNEKIYAGVSNGGCLLEWNGTDAWLLKASTLNGQYHISALCVFNGEHYGVDAWVQVAPQYSDTTNIYSLCVFNNKLYGAGGRLLEWNGVDSWTEAAPKLHDYTYSLYVFKGKLYSGAYGYLIEWNGTDTWVQVADRCYDTIDNVYDLIDYENQLYGGAKIGYLLMWNSTYTPAEAATDFKKSISNPIAVDVGNLAVQEKTISKTTQLASFTTNENAVWAAKNQLRKESYPFASLNISVNRNLFRLEVGDCFKFSYSKYGISNAIYRVLQISEENLESEKITIHAMEDVFGISNIITEYTALEGHAIQSPTYALTPFTHQRVLEAMYALSDTIKVLPLACRERPQDLGIQVYISIDGGSSYSYIDKVSNLQPYGTLVTEYPANTYTLDNEVGFEIDFVDGASSLDIETWPNVFSAEANFAILGNEVISFKSITPVTAVRYKFEGIIRGRFGTQKATHPTAEEVYFISKYVGLVYHAEIVVGVSRKFKLVPYNIKFAGDISEAVAIDLTIEGESKKPYIPVNFNANDGSFAARYTDDITLTWSPRYRGKGAGIGIPGTILADTDREGFFEIEVWVAGVKKRTTTAIDAATWTYTSAMNTSDNGALTNTVLFKLINYRTEGGYTYASDQVEVTCKKS